jgi:hypothetical protein
MTSQTLTRYDEVVSFRNIHNECKEMMASLKAKLSDKLSQQEVDPNEVMLSHGRSQLVAKHTKRRFQTVAIARLLVELGCDVSHLQDKVVQSISRTLALNFEQVDRTTRPLVASPPVLCRQVSAQKLSKQPLEQKIRTINEVWGHASNRRAAPSSPAPRSY